MKETHSESPELAVVVFTVDNYETIRLTMRHLRAQTAADRLEILLVAPSLEALRADTGELACFGRYELIEIGPFDRMSLARAAGAQRATAPYIAFAEDHCFWDADCAEALIRRHRQGWGAVGLNMYNANPRTATSWANLLLNFGPFLANTDLCETPTLPAHNTSYRRDLLLKYGEALPDWLLHEWAICQDLREQGYRFCLEPAARARHTNVARPLSFLVEMFSGGQLFGSGRARKNRWGIAKRAAYILAAPLIVAKRLSEVQQQWHYVRSQQDLPAGLLFPILVGLITHTLGEAAGYAFGPGRSEQMKSRMECPRRQHVSAEDWEMLIQAVVTAPPRGAQPVTAQ